MLGYAVVRVLIGPPMPGLWFDLLVVAVLAIWGYLPLLVAIFGDARGQEIHRVRLLPDAVESIRLAKTLRVPAAAVGGVALLDGRRVLPAGVVPAGKASVVVRVTDDEGGGAGWVEVMRRLPGARAVEVARPLVERFGHARGDRRRTPLVWPGDLTTRGWFGALGIYVLMTLPAVLVYLLKVRPQHLAGEMPEGVDVASIYGVCGSVGLLTLLLLTGLPTPTRIRLWRRIRR